MQLLLDFEHEWRNLRSVLTQAERCNQCRAVQSAPRPPIWLTAPRENQKPLPTFHPLSVVPLTSSESATGSPLSPHAEAAARVSGLKGIRRGNVSIFAMIIVDSGHPVRRRGSRVDTSLGVLVSRIV